MILNKADIVSYLLDLPNIGLNQSSSWWGSNLSVACLCGDPSVVLTMLEREWR